MRMLLALVLAAGLQASDTSLPPILRGVGFDQNLNAQLPLDVPFRDESGAVVRLRNYFGHRPVVFALVYYECPMLCTEVLNGVVRAARAIPFDAGDEYDIVAVSINPRETPELAAEKKKAYVEKYKRPGGERGWHFLTGPQDSITRVAKAAGFRYEYDPQRNIYAHAGGIMVATPEGRLARYFYGVEYSARDVRLALVEAAGNKIGSPVDQFLLFCFHYDPTTGKYGLLIQRIIRISGTLTALGVALLIGMYLRRDRRAARQHAEAAR
jgi:protein SCO1/2